MATAAQFPENYNNDYNIMTEKRIIANLEILKISALVTGAAVVLFSLVWPTALGIALACSYAYLTYEAYITHKIDIDTILSEINQKTFRKAPFFGHIYRSARIIKNAL